MLNSRWLKILACVLMTVDHVGYFIFPRIQAFRIVGRLSYPLFAFLIAYGCIKTRDTGRFFLRLISFAVMLQAFWEIAGMIDERIVVDSGFNIFFTLSFGVLAVWIVKSMWNGTTVKNKIDTAFLTVITGAIALLVCIICGILNVSYGAPGVLLIVLFFAILKLKVYSNRKESIGGKLNPLLIIGRIFLPAAALALFNSIYMLIPGTAIIQWYSMFSAVVLWFFADRKLRIGCVEKWLFYIYYPLHIIILNFIGGLA